MNPSTDKKDTKEIILDVAEKLFAKHGYHATSLRKITTGARVNLAAVNYHFGSKEKLLEAVFERRIIPLNNIRLDAIEKVLEKAKRKNERPDAASIMRAFIEPTLRFKDKDPGAKDFILLVGRSNFEADETARNKFIKLVSPVFIKLTEALKLALPDIPEDQLMWRSYFTIGAMAHTMKLICGETLIGPLSSMKTDDTNALIDMLVGFVSAGFEAP